MNETELIRGQLALERAHLAAVAQACAAAQERAGTPGALPAAQLEPFQRACVEYLGCVLGRFQARDRRLADLAAGRDREDPWGARVAPLLGGGGGSGAALEKLAAAAAGAAHWDELARFLQGPWSARREALEQPPAQDARAAHWRLLGAIDADGILEERTRFARVGALLPAGLTLGPRRGA